MMAKDLVKQFRYKYEEFVKTNPLVVSELETSLRWVSYLISGRFQNSHLVSELLYSVSSLLQLTNDLILRKAAGIKIATAVEAEALQVCVSTLEYIQVFCELLVRKSYGEYGKWLIIFVIQTTKAILRLLLVFKYDQGIQRTIPVAPLDRKAIVKDSVLQNGGPPMNGIGNGSVDLDVRVNVPNATVTLKRSKRLMRSLDGAPPRSKRTWFLPSVDPIKKMMERNQAHSFVPTTLHQNQKLGELLHILRPVAHLTAMRVCGQSSWAPYLLSLSTDVVSLRLLSHPSSDEWNVKEKLELGQRSIALLLYLLRSPLFDKYTKHRVLSVLRILSERIPLFGRLIRPLIDYLPEWQKVYFYVWIP